MLFMRRYRSTKIVATLGPASATESKISDLMKAGVDVFRLNFSHGTHADHQSTYRIIRKLEGKFRRPVAVMADLQGPKLRIGTFKDDSIDLESGAKFRLDLRDTPGTKTRVRLPHPEIFEAAKPGTDLLLDDGKIRLRVKKVTATTIDTEVLTAGTLSNRKGVNVPGVLLRLSALSDKDHADLSFVLDLGVDWIALSFVQRPEDVAEAGGDRAFDRADRNF
jgi:pyruvate kinase